MLLRNFFGALVLVAISTQVFAQGEKITVKRSSIQGRSMLVEANLADRAVDLTCSRPTADCNVLEPGDYKMVRLAGNEGSYNDCQNVRIYSISADLLKEKPLGLYCLLQP